MDDLLKKILPDLALLAGSLIAFHLALDYLIKSYPDWFLQYTPIIARTIGGSVIILLLLILVYPCFIR